MMSPNRVPPTRRPRRRRRSTCRGSTASGRRAGSGWRSWCRARRRRAIAAPALPVRDRRRTASKLEDCAFAGVAEHRHQAAAAHQVRLRPAGSSAFGPPYASRFPDHDSAFSPTQSRPRYGGLPIVSPPFSHLNLWNTEGERPMPIEIHQFRTCPIPLQARAIPARCRSMWRRRVRAGEMPDQGATRPGAAFRRSSLPTTSGSVHPDHADRALRAQLRHLAGRAALHYARALRRATNSYRADHHARIHHYGACHQAGDVYASLRGEGQSMIVKQDRSGNESESEDELPPDWSNTRPW